MTYALDHLFDGEARNSTPLVRIAVRGSRKIRSAAGTYPSMTFQDYANPVERFSSSFLFIVCCTKKNASDQPRSGRNVAKDNALPAARIGDRQWRKREKGETRQRVNRACCFPFALKKSSSRMNAIISLRETARRHWSGSIILRYIFVGSSDLRRQPGSFQAPCLRVADKLSSLRHLPFAEILRFSIFPPLTIFHGIVGTAASLVTDERTTLLAVHTVLIFTGRFSGKMLCNSVGTFAERFREIRLKIRILNFRSLDYCRGVCRERVVFGHQTYKAQGVYILLTINAVFQ